MQSFPSDILNELRKALEAEKTALQARIAELSAQDPFSDPDRLNDNAASDSEANEESSHDRFTALVEESQVKLTGIDNALVRIQDGSYGYCTNCKQLIDTDRLSILPTAELCLSCEKIKKEKLVIS